MNLSEVAFGEDEEEGEIMENAVGRSATTMSATFDLETKSLSEMVFNFTTMASTTILSNITTKKARMRSKILPSYLTQVEPSAWFAIYVYLIVFAVSAVGNFSVLVSVCKRLRRRYSPMNRLLLHLCIADIIVIFMVAAVEVVWRISIRWYAGNFACKMIQFFRAFGLYLSSLVLICISLDRYYAVVYPLKVMSASRRVKIMLILAWLAAILCAAPQCYVFEVESHPEFPVFQQCMTNYVGPRAELVNTALFLGVVYFIPLGVIIFCYGSIVHKISIESEAMDAKQSPFLRRNGSCVIGRAKIRTLKMTFVIVFVFFVCWTPYVVITMWHMIDRKTAEDLNGYIQDALFIMVLANSFANSLVYGFFHRGRKPSSHLAMETSKDPEMDRGTMQLVMRPSSFHRHHHHHIHRGSWSHTAYSTVSVQHYK